VGKEIVGVRKGAEGILVVNRVGTESGRAINAPFPSTDPAADLISLAASNGTLYSAFETPVRSYAIVDHVPAINIDRSNHASIVHWDERYPDGKHIRENATLWNVVAGSAQIITDGVRTIPTYTGGPHGIALLTPSIPADTPTPTRGMTSFRPARRSVSHPRIRRSTCLPLIAPAAALACA